MPSKRHKLKGMSLMLCFRGQKSLTRSLKFMWIVFCEIFSELFTLLQPSQLALKSFNVIEKMSFDFLESESRKIKTLASVMLKFCLMWPSSFLSSSPLTLKRAKKAQCNDFTMIYHMKINKKSSIINITAAGILNERKGSKFFCSPCADIISPHIHTATFLAKRLFSLFSLNGKNLFSASLFRLQTTNLKSNKSWKQVK